MKITLNDVKDIQDAFKYLLKYAPDLGSRGICYYLAHTYNLDVRDTFDIYIIIKLLMKAESVYIGETNGYNDDRIMFLLLFTEISVQDLHEILEQALSELYID